MAGCISDAFPSGIVSQPYRDPIPKRRQEVWRDWRVGQVDPAPETPRPTGGKHPPGSAAKKETSCRIVPYPNLLEHETFTDLLWAVFHLAEELAYRKNVSLLPNSDYEHLIGDIKRVHVLLLSEWLDYMKHLREDYPYLFSLAVRTNPFNPDAKTEVG